MSDKEPDITHMTTQAPKNDWEFSACVGPASQREVALQMLRDANSGGSAPATPPAQQVSPTPLSVSPQGQTKPE